MQRQASILSFLKKPPPEKNNNTVRVEKQSSRLTSHFPEIPRSENGVSFEAIKVTAASSSFTIDSSSEEIRGTDTPPEKVPRKIFAVNDDDNTVQSSVFSSIKHKFVKFDCRKNVSDRNQKDQCELLRSAVVASFHKESDVPQSNDTNLSSQEGGKQNMCSSSGKVDQGVKGCPSVIEVDDDVLGPETPGMRPLVPRLKRMQEEICNLEDKGNSCSSNAVKRVKFLQDSKAESKNHEVDSELTSKFEWLHPSQISDGDGRRPDNPLYDKRTLYIPPDALKKMSASQKQYWEVKRQYMDVVIFFKVGKFYELYEIDAEIGHRELDWKMTVSGVGKCRQVGISESGIDDAVQKLIARGYKVGRIEQLETSEQAKSRGAASVIQRKLVGVLTPSTTTEDNIGPDAVHLLAIKESSCAIENGSSAFGFAFVDCAALKFWVGSISDDASCAALGSLLMQVSPKEVIFAKQGLSKEAQKALKKYSLAGSNSLVLTPTQLDADFSDASEVKNFVQLKGYFQGSHLEWDGVLSGVIHQDLALHALGGLANHLSRLMLEDVLHNGDVLAYQVYEGCLRMDGQTLANLEIFNNNADGGPTGTLYKYLDNCITSSAKRLLRNWICHPLRDVEKINHRLDVVQELVGHPEIVLLVAQYLRKIPDLERLLGCVKASINSALLLLPLIGHKLLKQRVKAFGSLVKGLRIGIDLPLLLHKEGYMSSSLSKVLCLPVLVGDDGLDKFLSQFEAAVDSDFPNYQNQEVTDSTAETLSILMELFVEKAMQWSQVIHALNCIDVLRSFAVAASFSSAAMCRPTILPLTTKNFHQETGGPILTIKGLWHPYALGENGVPVPNDINLGCNSDDYQPFALLLTGPNMGGKSTLLRATCLAVILAQLGSFVPSELCVLSLVDIIFTRLGASDRIMTGESTFLIECSETASVLGNATQDSLVLLDELGRGTSTFDGYAIAYAVFRHLVETVNCRLLFATHYHPLTKEFASHPRVTLQHMACSFKSKSGKSTPDEQELIFLYKLASGACPESYGMLVATMAGIPKLVVESASEAALFMKNLIGESFKSSEQRSNFSTMHEEWFKTLLAISKIRVSEFDDDVFDTLVCLWHELKNSNRLG